MKWTIFKTIISIVLMLSCAPLPKKTPRQPTLKKKTKKRTNQKTKTKDVILKELFKKRFFRINLSVHIIYMYFMYGQYRYFFFFLVSLPLC